MTSYENDNEKLKKIIRELPCRFSSEKKLQDFKHSKASLCKKRYRWKNPNLSWKNWWKEEEWQDLWLLGSEEWQDLWLLGSEEWQDLWKEGFKVINEKEWQDLWIMGAKKE